jgi:c-di-GMP-binding flagellar brake protein YcgR
MVYFKQIRKKSHGFPLEDKGNMATKFEEKRKCPRISLHSPLCFWIKGTHSFNNTVSSDISLKGVGCLNDNFIAPETPVILEISLASLFLRPAGRIVWSAPLPHSDRYRLGIEFLEMDPKDRGALAEYIDMQTERL